MSSFRVVGNNRLGHSTSHLLKVLKYSVEVKFVLENAIASRRTSECHTLYSHQSGSFDLILSRPPLLVLTPRNVDVVLYPFHVLFWRRVESNQDGTKQILETATGKKDCDRDRDREVRARARVLRDRD